jgi:hypothetical protein
MSAERPDQAFELLKSPDFWAFGGGGVAVWGQRPRLSEDEEIARAQQTGQIQDLPVLEPA